MVHKKELSFGDRQSPFKKNKTTNSQLIQNLFLPLKLIDYQIQRNC
jgi:hypothetical protein